MPFIVIFALLNGIDIRFGAGSLYGLSFKSAPRTCCATESSPEQNKTGTDLAEYLLYPPGASNLPEGGGGGKISSLLHSLWRL